MDERSFHKLSSERCALMRDLDCIQIGLCLMATGVVKLGYWSEKTENSLSLNPANAMLV